MLTDAQKHRFEENLELDFSFGVKGLSRFRANLFNQRGAVGAVFRAIPYEIRAFEELGLPAVVKQICDKPRGLILVTGPTGSGKSTTLAAMIDKINRDRHEHILTIEPNRIPAQPQELFGEPARSKCRHAWLRGCTSNCFTSRPRHRTRRRNARPRDDRISTANCRNGSLDAGNAAHKLSCIDNQPYHRCLPVDQQAQVRAQLSLVLEGICVRRFFRVLKEKEELWRLRSSFPTLFET